MNPHQGADFPNGQERAADVGLGARAGLVAQN